jgi:hypothetical protein
MTLREYFLKADGYSRERYKMDASIRFLAFCVAGPYLKDKSMTIYDFMPLEGDPTPEQIAAAQQENFEQEMIQARKAKEAVMTAFNNYGRVSH